MPNPALNAYDRSILVEGQFNSNTFTLTDGQRLPLPLTSAGDVKVSLSGSSSTAPLSTSITTPQSTLTRPANTTAYAAGQLIASSTTAGSIVVPTFAIATSGGRAAIPRLNLSTNVTSGWGNVSVIVSLFVAAPTYSGGDGTAYAIATGAAKLRAQYAGTFIQLGDGASAQLAPLVATAPVLDPDTAAALFWDIQIQAAATPISGQTFTLIPEIWN